MNEVISRELFSSWQCTNCQHVFMMGPNDERSS